MTREAFLEPMVAAAIAFKRETPRTSRPPLQSGTRRDRYMQGVARDVDDMAAIHPSEALLARLRETLTSATEADVQEAIVVADALQQCGLFAESEYGDSEAATDKLAEQVPGFSRPLYRDVIAYFGYINH